MKEWDGGFDKQRNVNTKPTAWELCAEKPL